MISYSDTGNRDSLALAIPIKDTPWVVIVSIPRSEIINDFYSSLATMVISLLGALIVVGFTAWVFLLRLLRPIEEISKQAATNDWRGRSICVHYFYSEG